MIMYVNPDEPWGLLQGASSFSREMAEPKPRYYGINKHIAPVGKEQ